MATHSSILAWTIPWTEEPGGPPWGLKESDTAEQLTIYHYVPKTSKVSSEMDLNSHQREPHPVTTTFPDTSIVGTSQGSWKLKSPNPKRMTVGILI